MGHDCAVADGGKIIGRLREEALRHIVALKLLSLYPQHARLQFREEGGTWALTVAFPAKVVEYDARMYPTAEFVVVVDGNSVSMMRALLDELPDAQVVLKTSHDAIARYAVECGGRLQKTSISFTGDERALRVPGDVTDGTALDPDLAETFACFGNDVSYLDKAFRCGARWFANRRGSEVRSACVVYQNFESVWEVAGVLTQPEWRRQGLARCVVSAALQYLLTRKLQPRYQVDAENQASAGLARSLALSEFLRIEEILMPMRETAA
jgi:hypothetical protein